LCVEVALLLEVGGSLRSGLITGEGGSGVTGEFVEVGAHGVVSAAVGKAFVGGEPVEAFESGMGAGDHGDRLSSPSLPFLPVT
jgi:hypothetical protein